MFSCCACKNTRQDTSIEEDSSDENTDKNGSNDSNEVEPIKIQIQSPSKDVKVENINDEVIEDCSVVNGSLMRIEETSEGNEEQLEIDEKQELVDEKDNQDIQDKDKQDNLRCDQVEIVITESEDSERKDEEEMKQDVELNEMNDCRTITESEKSTSPDGSPGDVEQDLSMGDPSKSPGKSKEALVCKLDEESPGEGPGGSGDSESKDSVLNLLKSLTDVEGNQDNEQNSINSYVNDLLKEDLIVDEVLKQDIEAEKDENMKKSEDFDVSEIKTVEPVQNVGFKEQTDEERLKNEELEALLIKSLEEESFEDDKMEFMINKELKLDENQFKYEKQDNFDGRSEKLMENPEKDQRRHKRTKSDLSIVDEIRKIDLIENTLENLENRQRIKMQSQESNLQNLGLEEEPNEGFLDSAKYTEESSNMEDDGAENYEENEDEESSPTASVKTIEVVEIFGISLAQFSGSEVIGPPKIRLFEAPAYIEQRIVDGPDKDGDDSVVEKSSCTEDPPSCDDLKDIQDELHQSNKGIDENVTNDSNNKDDPEDIVGSVLNDADNKDSYQDIDQSITNDQDIQDIIKDIAQCIKKSHDVQDMMHINVSVINGQDIQDINKAKQDNEGLDQFITKNGIKTKNISNSVKFDECPASSMEIHPDRPLTRWLSEEDEDNLEGGSGMQEPPATPVARDELALRRHRFFSDLLHATQNSSEHRVRFDPLGPMIHPDTDNDREEQLEQLVTRLENVTKRLECVPTKLFTETQEVAVQTLISSSSNCEDGSGVTLNHEIQSLVEIQNVEGSGRVQLVGKLTESKDFREIKVDCGENKMSVAGYEELVAGPVAKFLQLSQKIGGDVASHSKLVEKAFQIQRDFIKTAANRPAPSNQSEQVSLLGPTSSQIQLIQEFREQNRGSHFFNHLSAISESIPALGWVAVSPTPAPYVKEMNDAGQFYTNRVLKDWKEKDKTHVEWCKAWVQTLSELQKYIRQYHTTGLVWAKTGSVPVPPPPGQMPPPPPCMPVADFSAAAGDDRSALFAQINQGENITKSLKKVTSEMQTHKNSSLRTGPAPFKAPVVSNSGNSPMKSSLPANAPIDKAPVFTRDGKKWLVEYHKGNKDLLIDNVEMNNVVYMFRCQECTLVIKGKVNSVVMDSCRKSSVVFDSLVSSIEFVNCQSVQMQVLGKVPTISIDKTDGCQMYLSPDSLDVELITSKSSEMNVMVPRGTGDYMEYPVPEQFKTTVSPKGLSTTAVDSLG